MLPVEEGRGSAHGITGHVNWRGVKEGAMLIHSKLPRSAVNGPGERAVLWLQGCDLRCRGCWTPPSHAFDRTRDKPVDQLGEWILSCSGVEGVTFSGGEPFQQA